MVIHLVAVNHLFGVKLGDSGNRVCTVHAFNGALLILIGVAPRYRLFPVEVRSHRIAVTILLNLELLVAAVCRVGEALTDNGVAHPVQKLFVLGVCHLGLVHPEGINAHPAGIGTGTPHRVCLLRARHYGAPVNEHHAIGRRFNP